MSKKEAAPVFQYQSDRIFRDRNTGEPIENQKAYQGLCLVFGEISTIMMTWLVPMHDEDEPERFERAWGIPGQKFVPVKIVEYRCKDCRKIFTLKFYEGDFVVEPCLDDICPKCWEERENERYARIGLAEALGPGEAVFDGAW